MRFHVTFEGRFGADVDPDALESGLDAVMGRLATGGAHDPAIGGSLTSGEIEVSLTVEAGDLDGAVEAGSTAIRAAFSAGPAQPWPVEWRSARATLLDEPARAAG